MESDPLPTYRRELLNAGMSDHDVLRRIRSGELHRIRPGAFVAGDGWRAGYIEQRQRTAAIAATAVSLTPPVFSHLTAAAIWRLPLFGVVDERVHTVAPSGRAAPSNRRVARHIGPCDASDVTTIDGVLVTTLDRTVFDAVRCLPAEAGLALADAALRSAALVRGTRTLKLASAEVLRKRIHERIDAVTGGRGIRIARRIASFADPRAERPGESISRLHLVALGFDPLDLQVAIPGPHGTDYEVDFAFRTAFGEFDGNSKYTDPTFLHGRSPERALLDEKRREDWIRGTQRKPVVRWGMADLSSPAALAARLSRFGLTPPG